MRRSALLTITLLCSCSAPRLSLRLPIDCVIGEDCWVFDRPDVDNGPTFRDHSGGSHTYEGHNGTDVGVRHVGQAVATWVVAPADGTVVRLRDGVTDGALLASGMRAVDEEECGNAVVIDLTGGWEVQLCHLLRGTVAVTTGDHVAAGHKVGRVGWTGQADNPHVHMTVRHAGREVDPFTGLYLDDATRASEPLWAQPIPAPTDLDALVWIGFDSGPRPQDDTWPIDGGRGVVPAWAPSLVLSTFLWRPEAGDMVRTRIWRPDGTMTSAEGVQRQDRPRQTFHVEKTWAEGERPVGLWTGHVTWERDGRTRELWTSAVLK